jgi:saccharopine dehydrogenase (NAD+, L-lysine-forming)
MDGVADVPVPILLRAEVKGHEHRSPLTPTNAKALLDTGRFAISVERSDGSPSCRIFTDEEYERVGCQLVPAGSWPSFAKGTVVLGLKELPDSDAPHTNDHIFFAHAFKLQDGAKAGRREPCIMTTHDDTYKPPP